MKKLAVGFAFLLFVGLVFAGAQSGIKISDEYDRFKDLTTIRTDFTSFLSRVPSRESQPSITLAVFFTGKEMPEKMPEVNILFMSQSKEWKYLRIHSAFALADGELVKLGDSKRSGSVQRGYVSETIMVSTPFSEFKKFYRASTIEFKVGITEFIPSQAEIDHIREFIEYCESKK